MNYAIIGKGFIYPRHKQAIKDTGGNLVYTCDNEKEADFSDYRDMLKEPYLNIDCFVIATPNHLHAEMVRACLKTGKKVICEKPLTINTDFWGLDGVEVVHQLRYHPKLGEIRKAILGARNIEAVVKAYRDEEFWQSWKGDYYKSGGAIYILGSHIFDLLIHILGDDYEFLYGFEDMKFADGVLRWGNKSVGYDIELLDNRDKQGRYLDIDGQRFNLSLKDNLSFEGLHDNIYKSGGVSLKEARKSVELIDLLKKKSNS